MSRIVRVGLAAIVLVGVLTMRSLSVPSTTVACSCMPWPETLAAYRTDAQVRVLAGTVLALQGQRGTFGIERVFKGPVTGPVMQIDGGEPGMCGLGLKVGVRMVLATWTEGDVLHPSSCQPSAVLGTAEGDKLLADAESSYGGVDPPPGAPTEPTSPPSPPSPTDTGRDLALPLVMAGVLGVVLLLFGGLILMSRRKPGEGAP